MDLEQQLQNLISEAPQYGVPASIMEYGVVPVLRTYAQQLDHQKYYLRQTLENNLVLTVLTNHQNPTIEKKVIYAFPSVTDAAKFPDSNIDDANVVAQEFPVGQILFQMFTMKDIDSIIFVDQPNNYQQSKEIYCEKLQTAIKAHLKLLMGQNYQNSIA